MSILSGFLKTKKYRRMADENYQLQSEWTSSETVEMADGNTAEENLGSIKGITSSLASTDSGYALAADAGKNLQDQVNELNSNLKNHNSFFNKLANYESGIRVTTSRSVIIENTSFIYIDVSDSLPSSDYKIATYCGAIACMNWNINAGIKAVVRETDTIFCIIFTDNISGNTEFTIQYTATPKSVA